MEIKLGLKLFTYHIGLRTLFQLNFNSYSFGIIIVRKMRKVLLQFGKHSKVIRY